MSEYKPFADLDERVAEVAPIYASTPRRRAILDRTIAAIDREKLAELLRRHAPALSGFSPTGVYKYADLPFWIAHKVEMAERIGLDRMPPSDILDIGMGGGHFGAVAQALGHRVVGTDIAEPLYDDLAPLLGVERRLLSVERHVRQPDFGRRFDLVTIIWQCFDVLANPRGERWTYWSLEDWMFLLDDLADNQLRPGGAIYLQLNQQIQPDGDRFDPELMAWARARGAVRHEGLGELMFERIVPGAGFFRIDGPLPRQPGRVAGLLRRLKRA